MREIKFRAWDKERECIKDVISIDFNANKVYCVGDYTSLYNGKFELMQYTGLKDKNGVEIYDGDIVTAGSGLDNKFKVEYKINSFIFSIAYYKYIRYQLYLEQWQYSKLEVIGNIYENPELLEE